MGYSRFISTLDLSRPLVFLCGPYSSTAKTDRRLLLRKFISKKWKNKKISAFPVIVDNIFDFELFNKTKTDIKVNLLEEIISNISYQTYIFLDTMSTSYELGQFTNFAYCNTSNLSSKIFVDKQYKSRTNNAIGSYLSESMKDSFIEYQASYNNQGHIFFPKSQKGFFIPKEIIECLNKDSPLKNNYNSSIEIAFVSNFESCKKIGNICYRRIDNNILFELSFKTLFYFVSAVYREMKYITFNKNSDCLNRKKSKIVKSFISEVKRQILNSFLIKSNLTTFNFILNDSFQILLKVNDFDTDNLIYHMLYFSHKLHDSQNKNNYVVKQNLNSPGIRFTSSRLESLKITNNFISNIEKEFSKLSKREYTKEKNLTFKNKRREIITYSENHIGDQFRFFHKEIEKSFLSFLPSSKQSFAYKKGFNSLSCIKVHEGNIHFAKFDLHNYFGSIKKTAFSKKFFEYLKNKCDERISIIPFHKEVSSTDKKEISKYFKYLFYNYSLPIGFVSSPKISDFYLYSFDEKMSKLKNLKYSRYADDILLSSNDKSVLENSVKKMRKFLKEENLELNNKKTRVFNLINCNDSIKFLGITLIKRKNGFEYAISRKYLCEVSKEYCKLYNKIDFDIGDYQKIKGKIEYIKSISNKSFQKLKKIINRKLIISRPNCILLKLLYD